MMDPGKILSAQKIYIICQFFRISPALHKGDHASLSLTVLIYQGRHLLPKRIFFSLIAVHIRSKDLKLYFLFHGRRRNKDGFGSQICSGLRKRGNGSGQSDSLQRFPAQIIKPCQRQHQMGAPLRIDQCMKLIHDHRFCRAKDILTCFAGKHQIKGFRRNDQNVRRLSHHLLPFFLGCISGTDGYPDQLVSTDPFKRLFQIFTDVPSQGF